MLTWHPAGDVKVACSVGGHFIFLARGRKGGAVVRSLLAAGTVFESTAGFFWKMQSDTSITSGSGKLHILLIFSFLNYRFHRLRKGENC